MAGPKKPLAAEPQGTVGSLFLLDVMSIAWRWRRRDGRLDGECWRRDMLKAEACGLGVSMTVLVLFTQSHCKEGANINTYVTPKKQIQDPPISVPQCLMPATFKTSLYARHATSPASTSQQTWASNMFWAYDWIKHYKLSCPITRPGTVRSTSPAAKAPMTSAWDNLRSSHH